MKKLLFILITFLNFSIVFGQTIESLNYHPKGYNKVYLELGGQALYYSINYERIIETNEAWYPSLKVGASFRMGYILVGGMNINKRLNKKSQLTIGLGGSLIEGRSTFFKSFISTASFIDVFKKAKYNGIFKLGYQYSKVENKWFFGAAFMPLIYSQNPYFGGELIFIAFGGLQIGRYL